MSDSINLLPEDLQAKGYIPQPKVEPMARPVEIKTQVNDFNQANEVVAEINNIDNKNSFSNDVVAPMPQKPIATIVKRTPAPVKTSFWDGLFANKNSSASGLNRVNGDLNGKMMTVKKTFSLKSIINWLTAGSNGPRNNDQEDFGINLVHNEAETLPLKTICLKIFLRVLPAIIIIFLTYFVAQFYSTNIKSKTEVMVTKLSKSVNGMSDEDIARLENNATGVEKKVSIMRNIFDRHIYWTNLLDFLEESFIAEVYIKSLTAENSGNLIIEAQADSFTSVAKQYLVLQNNKNIREVSITGADKSGDEDRVTFSIKLKIWPGIMYPNAFLNKVKN